MPISMASPTSLHAPNHAAHNWNGRRVTLMGLGRHGGGLGAARYLAQRGAILTISDSADAVAISPSLADLTGLPIHAAHVGRHDPSDFQHADVVVVNPAVRPDHPCLQIAREAGATLTSEIELFLERCPAHVIGVTGSNGKSTTVTMLAEILRAAGRATWLGGNLGGSLLGDLDHMAADDWVVLELSSFQLVHLSDQAPLPEIALLTNCTPNHLDWHGAFAEYATAKGRLLAAPRVVLNSCDSVTSEWLASDAGGAMPSWPLAHIPTLRVPGNHNRQNAACAAAVAEVAGVDARIITEALTEFRGLEHRIEWIGEVRGRHFYNDSKATSPGATLAAIAALEQPVWLLAGGVSKGTDFTELAATVVAHTQGAALFGSARRELCACLKEARADYPAACDETLAESLAWCLDRSASGDAILLSPACSSFDQFQDFTDRGHVFRRLVAALS
jgi:UDP-N-acetylmuramoylalanine--D-glutamate ligase